MRRESERRRVYVGTAVVCVSTRCWREVKAQLVSILWLLKSFQMFSINKSIFWQHNNYYTDNSSTWNTRINWSWISVGHRCNVGRLIFVYYWINHHFVFMINGVFMFVYPLTDKKRKKNLEHIFHFAVYSIQAPRRGTCIWFRTAQLKMKKKCKYRKNSHIASLILSESWLILIKNSITLTMVINYIKRFINRKADKGFF